MNSYVAKIKRGINHYYTKAQALCREKRYRAYDTRVRYMFFEEKDSDVLLVSFPACAPNTAKYNYVRTLLPLKCNKLFLLDDFGANHRGCYFVEDNVERCTYELLKATIEKCDLGKEGLKLVFLGSSKGGYSALNFSFLFPHVNVVAGAPQYYLGKYLDKSDTTENLQFIVGEVTEDSKQRLDTRLQHRILSSAIKPDRIYLQYSNVEHTYGEHIKDLLADLKTAGIIVEEDARDYPKHGDLVNFFPGFLTETLKKILGNT